MRFKQFLQEELLPDFPYIDMYKDGGRIVLSSGGKDDNATVLLTFAVCSLKMAGMDVRDEAGKPFDVDRLRYRSKYFVYPEHVMQNMYTGDDENVKKRLSKLVAKELDSLMDHIKQTLHDEFSDSDSHDLDEAAEDQPIKRSDFIVDGPSVDGLWYVGIKDWDQAAYYKDKEAFRWRIAGMFEFIRFAMDLGHLDELPIEVFSANYQNNKLIGFPITRFHHIPDVPAVVIVKPKDAIIAMSGDDPKIMHRIAVKKKAVIEDAIERSFVHAIQSTNLQRDFWNKPLDDENF